MKMKRILGLAGSRYLVCAGEVSSTNLHSLNPGSSNAAAVSKPSYQDFKDQENVCALLPIQGRENKVSAPSLHLSAPETEQQSAVRPQL